MQKLPFLKIFLGNYGLKKIAKARVLALKVDNFLSGYSAALHAKKEKIKIMSAKANTGQILKISSKQKLDFASTL